MSNLWLHNVWNYVTQLLSSNKICTHRIWHNGIMYKQAEAPIACHVDTLYAFCVSFFKVKWHMKKFGYVLAF